MNKIFLFFTLIFHFSVSAESPKYVLVTASTGALGSDICKLLAEENQNLIITGRNMNKLLKLKKELNSINSNAIVKTQIIDFADANTIKTASKNLKDHLLSGIVLISARPKIDSTSFPPTNQWKQLFNIGFIMPLETIKSFSDRIDNNSSIVVMSGLSSKYLMSGYSNSNVLRITWNAQIKNLAKHLGKRNIRINAISPGIIMTQHHENRIKRKAQKNGISYQKQLEIDSSSVPLNKFGESSDIANLVSFLISTKSKHINGSNIALDGGQSTSY